MILQRTLVIFSTAMLFAWSVPVAQAEHYSGGSLTYECIGNNFYKFYLDLYLDCSGNSLTPQGLNFTNDCGVVFSVNNLPVVLSEEVSQLCTASLPNSTCNGGVLRGLRHHRLSTTVYLSPCNDWSVSWGICCRATTENLAGTPGMYLGCTVNNFGSVCDRSPQLADFANPVVCVNEQVLYNAGINDPDGHTMTFELIQATYANPAPIPVQYQNGFSGAEPIPGIVLDPLTGQLSFTPTVAGNYVVVMKVTTYNALGAAIGFVMRDFMVVAVNCMGAPPQTTGPTISERGAFVGPNHLEVCDGVPFCLEFPFSDADPGSALTLTSNATTLLPGATFTVAGTNPAVGTLCWTPQIARSKTNVHFKASDVACPIPNVASSSILITVVAPPAELANAGTDGAISVCFDQASFALSGLLGGLPDPGGTWSYNGVVHGPNYDPSIDDPGVYTYTVTGTAPCATDAATVTVTEVDPNLILEFQNDVAPSAVAWEILDESGNSVVLSGTDPFPASSIGTLSLCLFDGCYRFRATDNAGDGLVGYELREIGANGRRIIDNSGNMITGTSAIAGGGTFCLPISDVDLIFSNCDKLDWVSYKYLVCHADPLVAGEWIPNGANNVQDANSGYEFWIYDPNGSYSFRKFHAHNVSDGFSPASANRACRLKIHNWYNTALTPHIPEGVLMNVRVRGRVEGVNQPFGPACTMMMDAARASCPIVKLQDDPAFPSDYSCGVTRTFGGTNTVANKIVALPPQFSPAPYGGGTGVAYQFRFRIPGEGVCIVRPPQYSPTLYLNWPSSFGEPLQATKTYEVEVRVSKDQGATWCVDVPVPACDPSPVTTWGKVCSVTISGVVNAQGGSSSIATQSNGALTMYPNPNRGDQLFIALDEIAADVHTVSVDIFDLTGKRIVARTVAVLDGLINTSMHLNSEIANGLYMVNITAGEKTYAERLVIQK